MATLAAIRTLVSQKLDGGQLVSPSAAEITAQINLTIDLWQKRNFWFNEGSATLTATVNDPVLSNIPSDFGSIAQPNGLVIIDNTSRYPLKHITPLEYDTINTEGQGLPFAYTYRNGQFELIWYPAEAYTTILSYRKKYVDLVDDGDTNDFTNNAQRLVIYQTLLDLLADNRSDQNGRVPHYKEIIKTELATLKIETNNRTATGMLTTENIVESNDFFLYSNGYGYGRY